MTEPKVWPCIHINEGKNGEWLFGYEGRPIEYWNICPVEGCNAKRPEAKKKLWEIFYESKENSKGLASIALQEFERIIDEIDEVQYEKGVDFSRYLKAKLKELQ